MVGQNHNKYHGGEIYCNIQWNIIRYWYFMLGCDLS